MIEKGTTWIKHTGRFVLDGYFRLAEQGTAFTGLTPIANNLHLYAKDSSGVTELFYKNSAGTERNLSGGLTGSGTANRLAYWSAAQVLDDLAALTQHRLLVADANGLPINGNALAAGSVLFGGTNGIPEDDGSKFFWNDTQKALIVGNGSAKSTSSTLEVVTTSAGDFRGISSQQYSADIGAAQINLIKARGTFAAPTAVLSADGLGALFFRGWGQTTTVFHATARIAAFAAENFSDTVAGSFLTFDTTPTGSITRAERLRIAANGTFGFGTTMFTGATAGDLIIPQGKALRSVDEAGTALRHLISNVGTGDNKIGIGQSQGANEAILIGGTGSQIGIGDSSPDVQGLSVKGNTAGGSQQLRLENAAAAGTNVGSGVLFSASGKVMQATFKTGWTAASTVNSFIAIEHRVGSADSELLRIQGNNISIGETSFPATGSKGLLLGDGTALASLAANTAGFYADDVAGTTEMFTIDEAGAATQISPHNFTMFDPDSTHEYPWSYYSKHHYIGKEIGIDMWRLVKAVELLSGEKILHIRDLPLSEVRNWDVDQAAKVAQSQKEIDDYERLPAGEKAKRKAPVLVVAKQPPKWIKDRLRS